MQYVNDCLDNRPGFEHLDTRKEAQKMTSGTPEKQQVLPTCWEAEGGITNPSGISLSVRVCPPTSGNAVTDVDLLRGNVGERGKRGLVSRVGT